jgi:hypothetical protein
MRTTKFMPGAIAGSMLFALTLTSFTASAGPRADAAVQQPARLAQSTERTPPPKGQQPSKQAELCTKRRLVHYGHPDRAKGYDRWETVVVPCKDERTQKPSRG